MTSLRLDGGSEDDSPPVGGADATAEYWLGAANAGLPNAHNLGALATGLVISTAGVPSIATLVGLTLVGNTLTATGGGEVLTGTTGEIVKTGTVLSLDPAVTGAISALTSGLAAAVSVNTGQTSDIASLTSAVSTNTSDISTLTTNIAPVLSMPAVSVWGRWVNSDGAAAPIQLDTGGPTVLTGSHADGLVWRALIDSDLPFAGDSIGENGIIRWYEYRDLVAVETTVPFYTVGTFDNHVLGSIGLEFLAPLTVDSLSTFHTHKIGLDIAGVIPLTTKGDILGYSTIAARVAVGSNGKVLTADSTAATGVSWQTPSTFTSPLTTKGDIFTRSASADARLAVGTDGFVLTADAASTNGIKWAAAASTGYSTIERPNGTPVTARAILSLTTEFTATDNVDTTDIALATNGVAFSKIAQGSARSVLGVTGNATADVASIQGTADQVLRINAAGTALAFGTIATAGLADAAVTLAKQADLAALSVPGRASNSSGVMAAITAGTDGHVLRLSGTTLGFGTLAPGAFGANVVGDVALRQGVARSVIGVTGNATGNVADIQGAADGVLRVNTAGTALAFGNIVLGAVTPGATKRIPFGNSGGTGETDSADLTWDDTNKRIIGQGGTYSSGPSLELGTGSGAILKFNTAQVTVATGAFTFSSASGHIYLNNGTTHGNLGLGIGSSGSFNGATCSVFLLNGTAPSGATSGGAMLRASGGQMHVMGTDGVDIIL